MARRLRKSVLFVGILLACLTAVATGAAAPATRQPQGFSRLLDRRATAGQEGSLVEDCLMETARLRSATKASGTIPQRQFEELRSYCRQAARIESWHPTGPDADADERQRLAERQQLQKRHAQNMRQLGQQSQRDNNAASPFMIN